MESTSCQEQWEELLNATIRGARADSTLTEKEAEGGTSVGVGARVGVGVGTGAVVGVGTETIPVDGVGSAGVPWEGAGDAPGNFSDVVMGVGSTWVHAPTRIMLNQRRGNHRTQSTRRRSPDKVELKNKWRSIYAFLFTMSYVCGPASLY